MENNLEKEKIKQLEKQVKQLTVLVTENIQNATGQYSYYPNIPMPKPIDFEGDLKANVNFFKATWKNYVLASGLSNRSEPERISVLLLAIGEKCFKLYENLPLSEEDRKTSDSLLEALTKHLLPEYNTRYERAIFNMAMQQSSETIDDYVSRLKTLSKTCEFKCNKCENNLSDEFVLDRLCISISNVKMRKHLYDNKKLTLQEAVNKIKSEELSEAQLNQLNKKEEEIQVITQGPRKLHSYSNNNKLVDSDHVDNSRKGRQAKFTNYLNDSRNECLYCGRLHPPRACPAYGKQCTNCKKFNHFAKVCKSQSRTIKQLETVENNYDGDDSVYCLKTLQESKSSVAKSKIFL